METTGSIHKGVVEPSYKNPPGKISTMLVTAGIKEENQSHLRITPRWERAPASTENDM